jgi:outer membrane protein OmpA-like peptidoglycan-associated protein
MENIMKKMILLTFIIVAGVFTSCATATPKELVSARDAYIHANGSIAADIAPAELHVAKTALDEAEQSFKDDPTSFNVRDLAYIAQRKCEIAEVTASITLEKKKQELAKTDYLKIQSFVVARTKRDLETAKTALVASEFNSKIAQRDLSQSESALAESELDGNIARANLNQSEIALAKSEHGAKMTQEQLAAEKVARIAAEKRASDAQKALAKLGAVKNEPRGVVITISGSVLFASNQTILLPSAKAKLSEIADVLLTTRERHLIVEGYTDSQGSNNFNLDLSQRRAEAVRNYLIEKGYEGDLIVANGLGESNPVGNNNNPEGRANNRRVEIIIEKELITAR